MRIGVTTLCISAALALAGCGGPDEAEREDEPMKVEDTAFGPLVGTPEQVRERTDAAAAQHRDTMNRRIEDDEGGSREEQPAD
jgi:hypothetical protein